MLYFSLWDPIARSEDNSSRKAFKAGDLAIPKLGIRTIYRLNEYIRIIDAVVRR